MPNNTEKQMKKSVKQVGLLMGFMARNLPIGIDAPAVVIAVHKLMSPLKDKGTILLYHFHKNLNLPTFQI